MEATPYSIAEHTLEVHLRGIDGPVFLSVSETTARTTLEKLLSPNDDEEDPIPWLQLELRDRSLVLLNPDLVLLLSHRFDFWPREGPPPEGHYGEPITDAFMDEYEWAPPLVAFGIVGYGLINLHDQGRDTIDTLADTVPEGFVFAPFFGFTDDDGERTVVATERMAFVMLHPDVLGR